MEPKEFEHLTPKEAAQRFHRDFPAGTENHALEFADIYFSENPELNEFLDHWRRIRHFSDQTRQAESKETVERNWPEDKYG